MDDTIHGEAKSHGAIALLGTIGLIWGLRPDGSLWEFDSDSERPLARLPDEYSIMALVAGTERYPWLAELLPVRPANAIDCPICAGVGRFGIQFCEPCRALGWTVV